MKKQEQIAEIVNNLKQGVIYSNEVAGYSYSHGNTNMKICVDGKLKFYPNIETMAKAIFKSMNTGV